MPRINANIPTDITPVQSDAESAPPSNEFDQDQFLRYTDEGGDYSPQMNPGSMEDPMGFDSEADFQTGAMNPIMQADSQLQEDSLAAPECRNGFEQRWVRASAHGDNDTRNWLAAMKKGWRPRDPVTVPKAEHFYPVVSDGTRNFFRTGDLVLCERPTQLGDQEREKKRLRAERQYRAGAMDAEKMGREARQHEGWGGLEKQDRVTTSRGRRPATMVG